MPSEKYTARRGSVEDGMRMITTCFARAPQRCTSRPYMHFLLMFQEVRPISKTRNQLLVSCCVLCTLTHRPAARAPGSSSHHYSATEARPRLRRPAVLCSVLHLPAMRVLLGEA